MNLEVLQQEAERIGTTAAITLMNLCDTEGERQISLLVLIRQIQYHLMCNVVAGAQIANHVEGRAPLGRSALASLFGPQLREDDELPADLPVEATQDPFELA